MTHRLPPEPVSTLPLFRFAVRFLGPDGVEDDRVTFGYQRACVLRDEMRAQGIEAVIVEQFLHEELFVYLDLK